MSRLSSTRTRRSLSLTAAGVAALTAAACGAGNGSGAADPPAAWVTPSAPAPTTSDRVEKIAAACDLLPAKVVGRILGGSAGTKLTAREDPVEDLAEGKRRFTCAYGRSGQEPFALTVSTRPGQAGAATEAIDAIAEASDAKTTRVKGLGAGGVEYVTEGFRVLAVAVPYETELRLMVFTAVKIVPHDKMVEVAEHVVPQL